MPDKTTYLVNVGLKYGPLYQVLIETESAQESEAEIMTCRELMALFDCKPMISVCVADPWDLENVLTLANFLERLQHTPPRQLRADALPRQSPESPGRTSA